MNKFIITEEQIRLIKESISIDEIKLPEFIVNSIKDSKTSLGNHPSFPPENEIKFEEKILKKRYYELLTNIKKVDGVNGDISKKNLISKLSELTIKCKHIEEPIKDDLEKLCFEFVNDMFGLTPGEIDIECNLTDQIEIKQSITPKKMLEDFDDISSVESLNKEILKRRLIDSIVQGACVRCSSNYEKILTKIYSLDHRLPELYHDITAINEYLSFIKEQKPNNDNIGGAVSVDLTSEDPIIKSDAIIFPILVFETVKGIMELLCSHGLPESKKDAEYIIGKADFLLAENWDKRLGVGLWDLIMNTIGYDNANIMPSIFIELISTPVDEFNSDMREIFGVTKKGKSIINNIIDNISRGNSFEEIESTISTEPNEECFSPEELIDGVVSETDTTSAGEYAYDVPLFGDKETLDHKNLITRSIQDGLNESVNEPDIFTHTTYKIPSKNDLIQLNSFGLPANEIVKGLSYTIVGRGFKSSKTDAMILTSIKSLCEMYPDNQEYKKALEIVSK